MTGWRLGTFGPASEEPYRRRVTDRVRLVVAAILLTGFAFHVGDLGPTELEFFRFFNSLPNGLHPLFRSLYELGTLWALLLAFAAALIGRRWRLARDLLLAGVAAWGIARALGTWVLGSGLSASFKAVTRVTGEGPLFPSPRLALVVAVVATAAPYVTRPTRRLGKTLVVVLALSAIYLGTALPNDILGGLALGWGIAAAVHLVFGSPGGRPTATQVTSALAELGVQATDVHLAPKQPRGWTLMVGMDSVGPLEIRVIGRDEADAELRVSDDILVDVWRQVAKLHSRGIVHGALDTRHVLVGEEGPAVVGFATTSTFSPRRTGADVADLLVSTAGIAGEDRAVAAAVAGIGPDAVARALPLLQPAALTWAVRTGAGHGRHLKASLDRLRTAGAAAAGAEPPTLQELHRVSPTNLLMAVGTLVAAAGLVSQIGDPADLWRTLGQARWSWLAWAFALSMATNVAYAVGLMGTVVQRLPLWPTTEVQVSMSFANLAIPAVGGAATQVRFLQKQGADLASAVAAGGLLSNVANVVVQVGVLGVAVLLNPDSFHLDRIPVAGILRAVLLLVVLAGVAVAVVLGVPRLRQAVLPEMKQATATIMSALSSPRQLCLLTVGFAGASLLYGLCLLACLRAFDASLSYWTLLALSIAIGTIASLIPIPGGGAGVSSVGMSGALTGFGVPVEAAVAAVLVNPLVVNYLPAIPGWLATEDLVRRDYL